MLTPSVARLVPVLAAVGLVVAALLSTSPAQRREAAYSLTRLPGSYVEVSFAQATRDLSCERTRERQVVVVAVQSHLAHRETMTAVVTTDPVGAGRRHSLQTTLATAPGETSQLRASLPVPEHRGYEVAVRLVGRPEAVRLRCSAPV